MAIGVVEEETNEQMLKEWVENLREEGYKVVSAALPEFREKPRAVHGGPAPDLVAKDPENCPVFGILRTADEMGKEHTRLELNNYCRECARVMLLVRDRDLDDTLSTIDCCKGGTFEVWVAR